jgi:glycosyltransferase involved in cell wall biosynthesis
MIWGQKDRALAEKIQARLSSQGIPAELRTDYLRREEFARQLSETEIFVALPRSREGFFLPALEAMAAGCAVVCPDAVGNRDYCIDGETCLMPTFGDAYSCAQAVARLLKMPSLVGSLSKRGQLMSRAFSLEAERAAFHSQIDSILASGRAHRHVS